MKMRNVMIAVMLEILILVTAGTVSAQAAGTQKLTKDQARKLWENYLVQCGERVFYVQDYATYYQITECRGNISLDGVEFILDQAYKTANHIEAKGTLVIKMAEYRTCQYSEKKPELNSPWTPWMKPMLSAGGAGFGFTKRNGKIEMPGEFVKVACDVIAFMDAFRKK